MTQFSPTTRRTVWVTTMLVCNIGFYVSVGLLLLKLPWQETITLVLSWATIVVMSGFEPKKVVEP